MGEPVPIPDEVITMLIDKRRKEIAERPYTEIHRRFTLTPRKDQNREKMKRTMQKNRAATIGNVRHCVYHAPTV